MTTAIRPSCTIPSCQRDRKARGLCPAHYEQARRQGITGTRKPTDCDVDGCSNPRHARGWCIGHYTRWKRTGSTDGAVISQLPRDELVRLRRAVGIPDDGPTPEQVVAWRTEEAW